MLNDQDILSILADKRHEIPLNIVKTFCENASEEILNTSVFSARLLPVPPPLCFFEPSENGNFKLKTLFSNVDPNYSIVPFGISERNAVQAELGISYNAFYGELPLQSYTICLKNYDVPNRTNKQTEYFKETNFSNNQWSAGHMIAHRYSPRIADQNLSSTLQLKFNFIPEPYYWNCSQRNPLERRCADGYYGVYPIYNLRFIHGRTVQPYGYGKQRLPYRSIPDGEFLLGNKKNGERFSIYMPFITDAMKMYNSHVTDTNVTKIDITLANHKVNFSALPQHCSINFSANLIELGEQLNNKIKEDEKLASRQGNLFVDTITNPLHQAAVIRRERAAMREFKSINNKMHCALIFSELKNKKRTSLYLKGIKAHAEFLLDDIDNAELNNRPFEDRLFRDFKRDFAEQDQTIDVLQRLVP